MQQSQLTNGSTGIDSSGEMGQQRERERGTSTSEKNRSSVIFSLFYHKQVQYSKKCSSLDSLLSSAVHHSCLFESESRRSEISHLLEGSFFFSFRYSSNSTISLLLSNFLHSSYSPPFLRTTSSFKNCRADRSFRRSYSSNSLKSISYNFTHFKFFESAAYRIT